MERVRETTTKKTHIQSILNCVMWVHYCGLIWLRPFIFSFFPLFLIFSLFALRFLQCDRCAYAVEPGRTLCRRQHPYQFISMFRKCVKRIMYIEFAFIFCLCRIEIWRHVRDVTLTAEQHKHNSPRSNFFCIDISRRKTRIYSFHYE